MRTGIISETKSHLYGASDICNNLMHACVVQGDKAINHAEEFRSLNRQVAKLSNRANIAALLLLRDFGKGHLQTLLDGDCETNPLIALLLMIDQVATMKKRQNGEFWQAADPKFRGVNLSNIEVNLREAFEKMSRKILQKTSLTVKSLAEKIRIFIDTEKIFNSPFALLKMIDGVFKKLEFVDDIWG